MSGRQPDMRLPAEHRRLLAAVLTMAAAIRVVIVFITPLLFAPDEVGHVLYVHRVATDFDFPAQSTDGFWAQQYGALEFYQPPLFYLLAAPIYRVLLGLGGAPVYGVRLLNVVLGLLVVVVIVRIARLIFPERPGVQVASAAFAALLPTFISNSTSVNNDVLCVLLVVTASELMVRSVITGALNRWTIARLAMAVALALYAKTTAIALLPALILWGWYLHQRGRPGLRAAAIAGGISLVAIMPWWILRNLRSYGDLLGVNLHWPLIFGTLQSRLARSLVLMAWSLWLNFGRIYDIGPHVKLALVPLAAIGILSLRSLWAWSRPGFLDSRQRAALVLLAVPLLVATAGTLDYGIQFGHAEGRYLLPGLPILSLAVGTGVTELAPVGRRWGPTAMSVAMAGYMVAVIWFLLVPGFSRVVVDREVGVNAGLPWHTNSYDTWVVHRTAPLRPPHAGAAPQNLVR